MVPLEVILFLEMEIKLGEKQVKEFGTKVKLVALGGEDKNSKRQNEPPNF